MEVWENCSECFIQAVHGYCNYNQIVSSIFKRKLCTIKNWSQINISWQNQPLLLRCQARLITFHPNVLLHYLVTPPSIKQRGFSRQSSLFYPSVNQHPQAESLDSSCQTIQHLPPHCFGSACTWLHAWQLSGLSRIKQEASCAGIQHWRLHCCIFFNVT